MAVKLLLLCEGQMVTLARLQASHMDVHLPALLKDVEGFAELLKYRVFSVQLTKWRGQHQWKRREKAS